MTLQRRYNSFTLHGHRFASVTTFISIYLLFVLFLTRGQHKQHSSTDDQPSDQRFVAHVYYHRSFKRNVLTAVFGKYRSLIDVASSNLFLNFAYYVIHYRFLYRVLSNHCILLWRWQIVKWSTGSTRYYCPRTSDATSHCESPLTRPQNETFSKVFRFFFFRVWSHYVDISNYFVEGKRTRLSNWLAGRCRTQKKKKNK